MLTKIYHVKPGERIELSGPGWVKLVRFANGKACCEVTELDPQKVGEAVVSEIDSALQNTVD